MKATSRITLKAFLLSLAERDELPPEWHSQLAQFDWNSDEGLAAVDEWASQHLNPSYERWCDELEAPLAQRSKGKPTQVDWSRENQLTQEEYRNFLQHRDDDLIAQAKAASENTKSWQGWRDRLLGGQAKG
ncbi:hypothetical protein AY600_18875 [Phormidium willei BDU 130791]|nr:hypothetical protein AY600_18875 [Phormidium willei BDU 130791]